MSHSNPALYLNQPGADGYSMSTTNTSEIVQDSTTTEVGDSTTTEVGNSTTTEVGNSTTTEVGDSTTTEETNKATYAKVLTRSLSDETPPSTAEEPVFQRVLSGEDNVPTQASGRTNSCAVPDAS